MRASLGAICTFIAAIVAPALALADAEAQANSETMPLAKYTDGNGSFKIYATSADAAKTVYSQSAKASNEGGTTGEKTFGPDTKFRIEGTTLYAKLWNELTAEVPSPGATRARATAVGGATTPAGAAPGSLGYGGGGFGGMRPGSGHGGGLNGADAFKSVNYVAFGAALAFVQRSTIPPGGFGSAQAKVTDPFHLVLPRLPEDGTSSITFDGDTFNSSAGERMQMHCYLDLTGSQVHVGPGGSASFFCNASIDGISSEYADHLLNYSASNDDSEFASTLSVASGVRIFLNDINHDASDPTLYYGDLEFNPATEVSEVQLKTYLDSFQTADGWSLDTTTLIGLEFEIPNSAPGIDPLDPSARHFAYHDDVFAQASNAVGVPEPAATAIASSLMLTGCARRRRISDECRR